MFKKQIGFGLIYIIIAVVVIAGVAAGAYYFGTRQKSETPSPALSPTPGSIYTPTITPKPTSTQSASPSASPLDKSKESTDAIKLAITGKSYSSLDKYMASSVNVLIEATECCGIITKDKALAELKYLDGAINPWNFDPGNPIASQLKTKNPTLFPNGILLGTSANRYLVTFTLNKVSGLIEKIYMAIDYKLHGI